VNTKPVASGASTDGGKSAVIGAASANIASGNGNPVRPALSAGLFFFLGKKERLAIDIRKNEFALISSLMMEADREAAIQAFANARAQSKPNF
jgi:hypothetical protein